MNKDLLNALVQLAISLGGAGLLVQLLLLRANRRKIAGEATSNEANAASTLSGAALKMVENAQQKEREAEARAHAAQASREALQREYDARRARDGQTIEDQAWALHHKAMREQVLIAALEQAGIVVPPEPSYRRDGRTPPPVRTDEPRPQENS